MSDLISVITPVHPDKTEYLTDAYESLVSQQMPDGWDWEWLVQEDGESGNVARQLPADKRIRSGSGRPGRAAVARNLALARARGSLIKVLDADDMLTLGALNRDISVLAREGGTDWTTSRVLDLLPDGSTVGFDFDPPEGPLTGTVVFDHWRAHGFRASVHPATLCIRRKVAIALGGWMALPASEDTGLLISASIVSNGWFIADAGLLYRKWPGQSTAHESHTAHDEYSARMRLIEERANVLIHFIKSRS